ncbi:thermonuclease family protein [Mesorhizobium sp. M0129]|uniref:thermonuclease family protein n=1 Tax=Mesorhizobium sp. M0129 TaxID=2956886 RepID=UPI00333978C7
MSQGNSTIIVPENPTGDAIKVPVLKVFDGDGFLTRIKASELTGSPSDQSELHVAVRFAFIDAPELEQAGGREAQDFLSALIADRWVELEIRMKMDTGRIVDRHERIVGVPYLTEEYTDAEFKTSSNHSHSAAMFGGPLSVTRNIELEMVVNGWAWVLERYGPGERYMEALGDAQRHKRGIWAAQETNMPPWEFKQQKHRQKRLTEKTGTKCPVNGCAGNLLKRNGRFGAFFGCSTFPACKYTCQVAV